MFALPLTPRASTSDQWSHDSLFLVIYGALCVVSVFYLGDILTPVLVWMNASLLLTPLAWCIMAAPSLCVGTGIYLAARRLARWQQWQSIGLAILPFLLQALVIAPISDHRLMSLAQHDGGEIPRFAPQDIIAVMDMPGHLGRGSGTCGPTCVHILEATGVEAIFLPRTYVGALGEASGVVYRIAPRGNRCDATVSLARRAPACLTLTPARLSQVTHILSSSAASSNVHSDAGLGRSGGFQIRLTGVGHGTPIYQYTKINGRAFSRLPMIGDPMLEGPHPHVALRFLSRETGRPLAKFNLMEWFAHQLIRRTHP
ncbi:hypothetical protein [Shimia ponticola]|uniref:hypothetical protein n=1 Tax=Shimia ponticola TaxID=2582893 RepID=UPI0011BF8AA0|nr:hypothetical protein [Shimia ponticola]